MKCSIEKLTNAVDKYKKLILETERYVWNNPETGYKEVKTSAYLEKTFKNLGYELTMADGVTGFYTVLDTGREGPEVLILGEMDSVICPEHPESDKETGAVHACGHCAQCGALVGVAAALKEPEILQNLCGKIKLCAVPAEETLEMDYRNKLMAEGKIKYYGGKAEFMHRGFFDTVDIAFMIHTYKECIVTKGAVGVLAKQVTYEGVASHAGSAPWNGRNALYAANCGLNAANALRETFKEEDIIRFHPIITSGGSAVNTIPSSTKIESFVRGRTYDAIIEVNRRINQALCGAALSLDTNINIVDAPGCAPLENDENMIELYKDAVELVVPGENVIVSDTISSGSTDMGDLSQIMPVVHPYFSGSVGKGHGSDYYIKNPEMACVGSAKVQIAMIYLLLSQNGEKAKKIIKDFKPRFNSVKEYLEYIDSFSLNGKRIEYKADGNAIVKINI